MIFEKSKLTEMEYDKYCKINNQLVLTEEEIKIKEKYRGCLQFAVTN